MKLLVGAWIFALVLSLAAGLAAAHSGASGVVKERMEAMEAIGAAMKSLAGMLRGATGYDADAVRNAAAKISAHGGEKLTGLFPKDSIDGPSEATPAIWDDWERFSILARRLSEYADALGAAAENERAGHMMGRTGMMSGTGPSAEMLAAMPPEAAFGHLAQTCKDCHRAFRANR
ncbi:cytochrome c [Nisaea acidiphila]|uniref:Cytochrome c n=1 Tax=Nisaea acidiphila TaxID=1862145 RepID=A0A9J7B1R8_9PROT|nr:cytochrome c [Nisaea acidiphila]UUX51613.1 cytochrome c [Nisaea acidiphila]